MDARSQKILNVKIEHKDKIKLVGKLLKTSFQDGRHAKEIFPFFHSIVVNRDMETVSSRKNLDQYFVFKMTPGSKDFDYLIGVEVEDEDESRIPEGMVSWVLEAQDYATMTFIKRGNHDVMAVFQYIAESWLPQSGFKSAGAPGFVFCRDPFFTVYKKYGFEGNPVADAFFAIEKIQ